MKRNVTLVEISDGRLYGDNDMVKADCHGCQGCFQCCRGMGNSIVLDPYDVYRLQRNLGVELQSLLASDKIELNVVDGVILPNLKMTGEQETCAFLNGEGRCSIHASRPGICRIFPLGRYYENGDFKYFLQTGECTETKRSKIKVSKWIDTPNLSENHDFIRKWHYFLNDLEKLVGDLEDMELGKRLNMLMLQLFFLTPYEVEDDFYRQFEERTEQFGAMLSGCGQNT